MKESLDLNKHKIFFFGSRVKGNNSQYSDIDIGIDGDEPISANIKFFIEDKLSLLPILYKIDLVDFSKVNKELRDEALKNIEYVK